jgi:hypothetical protein
MLCQLCETIFAEWEDCTVRVLQMEPVGKAWRKRGPHHSTVESLKASTRSDCYICHILLHKWTLNGGKQSGANSFSYHVDYSLNRDAKKYGGYVTFLVRSFGALAIFGLEGLSESGMSSGKSD